MKASYRKNKSGLFVAVILLNGEERRVFGEKQMSLRKDFLTKEEAVEESKQIY